MPTETNWTCTGCGARYHTDDNRTCPECGRAHCLNCGNNPRGATYCEARGCGSVSCCVHVCTGCYRCEECGCECSDTEYDEDTSVPERATRTGTFHGTPTPRFPRFLGVEIECGVFSWGPVQRATNAWGAGIHDDGSVNVDGSCAEIVSSPARGEAFEKQVAELCAAIHAGGGKVNRSCGLHVHVDARDATTAQILALVRLYARVEPTLYSIVARSRRSNTFVLPWGEVLTAGDVGDPGADLARRAKQLEINTYGSEHEARWAKENRSKHSTRYHGLNLNALDVHGTLEFRLHHGTINAGKILMWSAVCSALVSFAFTRGEAEIDALKGTPAEILHKILASDPDVARWVKARRRWFEDQDRVARGLPPRRAARPAAPPPPEAPVDIGPPERGETGGDTARVGRRNSYR